jgi:hemolysin activation/secretion protein
VDHSARFRGVRPILRNFVLLLARCQFRGVVAVALFAGLPLAAEGQVAPPIPPGQVAPPSSPVERNRPPSQPTVIPPVQPPAQEPVIPEGGAIVTVQSVELDGNTRYSNEELAQDYRSILGRPVTVGEVAEAVNRIQLRYRNDGYFLSAARGRLERVEGGVKLRVRVTEGYISDVKIDGESSGGAVKVYDFLHNLLDIKPVNIADIERYLLLAQNVPGISVRAVLRPTSGESGAIELIAQVARKSYDVLTTLDNRGPVTAGPIQALVSSAVNSFTSLGERVQLDVFNTPFSTEQVFTQLSVQGFVGSEGLLLRAYVANGLTVPGADLEATGYKGRVNMAGVSAQYPVIRTRALSLTVSTAFDAFRSAIDLGTPVRSRQSDSDIRVVRAGFDIASQDTLWGLLPAAANTMSIKFHQGVDGNPNEKLPARPNVDNDFEKYTAELVRVQDLFTIDDYRIALKLAVAGQWTKDILPPSEKMFLGGSTYGRGFFSGEITGDRAAAGTVELQANTTVPSFAGWTGLVAPEIPVRYYAFFDAGEIWDRDPGALRGKLQSAGLGAEVAITPKISLLVEGVNRFTLRPTGSALATRETPRVFNFQLRVQF